ncbi:MAG: glycosyltransferase family 9 protein [Acidobacteriota bacterium]
MRLDGKRVLVIRPGALGDAILALPAVRALRQAVGAGGGVEWVGYGSVLRLAVNSLHATAWHSIDRGLFAGVFSECRRQELMQSLAGFDVVVVWCRNPEETLASSLRGLGKTVVQSTPFPPPGVRVHASDHLLRSLAPLGIRTGPANPELAISSSARRVAQGVLRSAGLADGAFLAIHPGSGSPRKNWPPEKFSELARLSRRAGFEVLLIQGEADGAVVHEMKQRLPWAPPVADALDLMVLAALLSMVSVYVGNDSGVTHLAAAAGAPTVALFGPTDPLVWGPRGRWVQILRHSATPQQAWRLVQRGMRVRRVG